MDKLQEKRDGHGWSQHREAVRNTGLCRDLTPFFSFNLFLHLSQVTEEVLSILRLLHPLADPESKEPEPSDNENQLNAALGQLKNVARKLAFSHTKQVKTSADTSNHLIPQHS